MRGGYTPKSERWEYLRRLCHALARRVFGDFKLPGHSRACYDYFLKEYVRNHLGKASRNDLTEEDWEKIYIWLKRLEILERPALIAEARRRRRALQLKRGNAP